jgi:hypothetical protein
MNIQLVDSSRGGGRRDPTIGNAVALDITLTSEYAAGGIDQHMGYIISGTTADGIYLEVKDVGGGHRELFSGLSRHIAADLPLKTTRQICG